MTELIEQTEIAKRLGISNKTIKRITYHGKLEYKLINNKRHYNFKEVVKTIKKNISLSRTKEVIEWCRRLKIKTKGFFIVGHPTETIKTIDNRECVEPHEPLMVLRQEYLSDGGEEGFPWLH